MFSLFSSLSPTTLLSPPTHVWENPLALQRGTYLGFFLRSREGWVTRGRMERSSLALRGGIGPMSSKFDSQKKKTGIRSHSVNTEPDSDEKKKLPEKKNVLGCGGAGIDYLASVSSYPHPDDKIRTTHFQVQGGGNVGNALTSASRLGLSPRIITKIADDALGEQIKSELKRDGIDTSHMVIAEGGISPFTYIIVDRETSTRTCIHTPGSPPLVSSEVPIHAILAALEGTDLVYFDGRLTEVAINVAQEASKRGLPILVDAERPREGLEKLLNFATFVVASENFPKIWTGESTLGSSLLRMAEKLPRVNFIIVTLGAKGCVMFERKEKVSISEDVESLDIEKTLQDLREQVSHKKKDKDGNPIVASSAVARFYSTQTVEKDKTEEKYNATEKDKTEEKNNLIEKEKSEEKDKLEEKDKREEKEKVEVGRVRVCGVCELEREEVEDTTGAGDAFIGAILYAICADFSAEKMLPLASTVAATKCRKLGARPGLPFRNDPKLKTLL